MPKQKNDDTVRISLTLPFPLKEKIDKLSKEKGLTITSYILVAVNAYIESEEIMRNKDRFDEIIKQAVLKGLNAEDFDFLNKKWVFIWFAVLC